MADGTRRPIAEVSVGDRVLATDTVSGRTVVRTVAGLHRNHDADLVDVVVRDPSGAESTVSTTRRHRFWDDRRSTWVEARFLRPGDRLRSDDGSVVEVAAALAAPARPGCTTSPSTTSTTTTSPSATTRYWCTTA